MPAGGSTAILPPGATTESPQATKSQMREILEGDITFSWPDDPQHRDAYSESYFMFSKDYTMYDLLRSERNLSASKSRTEPEKSQVVGQYSVKPENLKKMPFAKPFAVKRIQHPPTKYKQTINEVETMKGLRFPHVAAFLGFFHHDGALFIATCPAGCCDLGDFLHCVSVKLEQEKGGEPWSPRGGLPPEENDHLELFCEPLQDQLSRLESWFLCLSTALEYLHYSKVRHKDIKPENIIVDRHGAVILVDFGISTKSDETTPNLMTKSAVPSFTSRYRPREINGPSRSDRSDVWSMGCVFLEMISPLFGKGTTQCKKHHTTEVITFGVPNTVDDYCEHPALMEAWFSGLNVESYRLRTGRGKAMPALKMIRQMLSPEQDHRPRAKDLWKYFDLANEKCRDCHSESNTKWGASDEQKVLHEEGQDHREQIMKKQEEKENRDKRLSGKFQLPSNYPAVPGSPTRKSFEISRLSDRTTPSSAWPLPTRSDGTSNIKDFGSRPRRGSLTIGRYPDSEHTIADASILDSVGSKHTLSGSPPGASIKLVIQEPRRSSSPSASGHRRYTAKSARPHEVLDAVPDEGGTEEGCRSESTSNVLDRAVPPSRTRPIKTCRVPIPTNSLDRDHAMGCRRRSLKRLSNRI